ncbi:hypothetical protein JOM56_001381 [Amanita muscaria]
MPVRRPNPPACPTELPPMPQDPPTLIDISNAIDYNKNILISHETGLVTQEDVGAGVIYQAALITRNGGADVPPIWFDAAVAQAMVQPLAASLAPLHHTICMMNRTIAMTYNLCAGDGYSRHFMVVPFVNGADPTAAPYNLPALVNVRAITDLTGPQCTVYLNGYNLIVPQAIADRKRVIGSEIGCSIAV